MYSALQRSMPGPLRRYVLHFDTLIEDTVAAFARSLPEKSRVLDAGAGESRHRPCFAGRRYVALDLAVGDAQWDYGALDVLGDVARLPFPNGVFDAALNIVTLEHVPEPKQVLAEIARVLRPGGRLLLIAPQEWEVHQSPHDYFRYTAHGLRYLLQATGFTVERLDPAGGYFRLMSRRLLNGLQFFPGPLMLLGALVLVPLALILPLCEPLDHRRDFTLGYVAVARRL
jgi:SAM-dependent methyltransferase